jgi:molybdate transport system ATP-binding protein
VKPLSFWCRHRFRSGVKLEARFETVAPVTALVGPSGAGKTSVLYALAGLLRPQEGEIRFGEHVFFSSDSRVNLPPKRRRVAMVFQDYLLFPHLSVERNLRYGLVRHEKVGIEFDRVVDVLELRPLLDRPPGNLSGGEKQRVALGRALLSGPELLLMDEPVTALDEPLKERILAYLQRVIDEWHIPTIYVSHSLADVRRIATHIVIIERREVVASDPTEKMFESPQNRWAKD